MTPEERELSELADEVVARWGEPVAEPVKGRCKNCRYFVGLDGEFSLLDYGVCIAEGGPFDGRATSVSSGCQTYSEA